MCHPDYPSGSWSYCLTIRAPQKLPSAKERSLKATPHSYTQGKATYIQYLVIAEIERSSSPAPIGDMPNGHPSLWVLLWSAEAPGKTALYPPFCFDPMLPSMLPHRCWSSEYSLIKSLWLISVSACLLGDLNLQQLMPAMVQDRNIKTGLGAKSRASVVGGAQFAASTSLPCNCWNIPKCWTGIWCPWKECNRSTI